MVHRDGMIFVEQGSASSGGDFARDASWIVRKDIYFDGFTSFESVYRPGRATPIPFYLMIVSWFYYCDSSANYFSGIVVTFVHNILCHIDDIPRLLHPPPQPAAAGDSDPHSGRQERRQLHDDGRLHRRGHLGHHNDGASTLNALTTNRIHKMEI